MIDASPGPRKVLHVLNSPQGGSALSVLGLIEQLRPAGIEACAVCHDTGTVAEREALAQAVGGNILFVPLYWWNRKIRARTWKRPLIELRQLWKTGWTRYSSTQVANFARAQQADLIHSNTILTLEGGLAARQLNLPHVWHVRELVGPEHPFRLPLAGHRLGQYLAAHADKLIANSHVTAAQLAPWVSKDLLEIVPNGIDLSHFRLRSQAPPSTNFVVAMVANLTSRTKRHDLFISAANLVDRSLPIEFRIYGHDPSAGGTTGADDYTNRIVDSIRATGWGERFRLMGYRADVPGIMQEIDLLVHPAENESFGRIAVEAMAAGLPVVGISQGGIGEIVVHGQTGLLAPAGDATALARQIEQLARDRVLGQRMGMAGRQRAEQLYSLEACAAGVRRVYAAACLARHAQAANPGTLLK